MNSDKTKVLFSLIRSAISGNPLTEQDKNLYTAQMLPKLISISQKHDISHLLAVGLRENKLLTEKNGELSGAIMKAVYRYEQLNYELCELCAAFEEAMISFMPLKGSVLRRYYLQPWMRTSCDIDVLVRGEDLDRAVDFLTATRGYTCAAKGSHDVSLFLDKRIHLELHYTLIGVGVAKFSCDVLSEVWKSSKPKEEKRFWYEMTDEMFYFYHVAHMAKHFEEGGCGIRPFIDLWILDNIEGANASARDELLLKGGLLKFAEAARRLSKIWFENAEADPLSEQMQDYVLRGGVYGNDKNRITVQQQKKGGRFRYLLSKIFIPYDVIKFHYPILQKHRWLTPFMQVRRWFKLLFCGHRRRVMRELNYNRSVSVDKAEATRKMLADIGLHGD